MVGGSLTVPNALALRRAVAAAGALAATLWAHSLATGDVGVTPVAPAVWLGIVAAAVVLGGRHRWRPRGVAGSAALMLALQTAAHLAFSWAPWAAGLSPHHDHGLALGPVTLATHAVAALVLALALARLERVLDAAMSVVTAVRRHLDARRPRPPARGRRLSPPPAARHTHRAARAWTCRGPPSISPA